MADMRDDYQNAMPPSPLEEKVGGWSARERIGKVGLFGVLVGVYMFMVSVFIALKFPQEVIWLCGVLVGIGLVYCGAGTILIVHSRRQKQPEGKLLFVSNLLIIAITLFGSIWGLFGVRWDNFPNIAHFGIAFFMIFIFRERLWKWARLLAWLDPTAHSRLIKNRASP